MKFRIHFEDYEEIIEGSDLSEAWDNSGLPNQAFASVHFFEPFEEETVTDYWGKVISNLDHSETPIK